MRRFGGLACARRGYDTQRDRIGGGTKQVPQLGLQSVESGLEKGRVGEDQGVR